jgi:hypothetical protein
LRSALVLPAQQPAGSKETKASRQERKRAATSIAAIIA